jgi:hypothetical protein
MEAMPRPRLPHLLRETTRHGKTVWYVRVGESRETRGQRIRIKAEYGTPEFEREYQAVITGKRQPTQRKKHEPDAKSLAWLWNRYRESRDWLSLSNATKRQRENIMKHVLDARGHEPFALIRSTNIKAGREARAATPAQARNFLDAVRGLFGWATEQEHIKTDPTIGVKNPKRVKGKGFPPWTEADVEAYEKRWPLGTKQRV